MSKKYKEKWLNRSRQKDLYIEYFENGIIKHSIELNGNIWNGKWISYYKNGKLRQIACYKNNKLNGLVRGYYKSGNIAYKFRYKNDEINGCYIEYYNNGAIKNIHHYKNDLLHGKSLKYDKNGRLLSNILYKNGFPQKNIKNKVRRNYKNATNAIFTDTYLCEAVEIRYDKRIKKVPFVVNKVINKKETKAFLSKAKRKHQYIHNNSKLLNKLLLLEINEKIPRDLYEDIATVIAFIHNSFL